MLREVVVFKRYAFTIEWALIFFQDSPFCGGAFQVEPDANFEVFEDVVHDYQVPRL